MENIEKTKQFAKNIVSEFFRKEGALQAEVCAHNDTLTLVYYDSPVMDVVQFGLQEVFRNPDNCISLAVSGRDDVATDFDGGNTAAEFVSSAIGDGGFYSLSVSSDGEFYYTGANFPLFDCESSPDPIVSSIPDDAHHVAIRTARDIWENLY